MSAVGAFRFSNDVLVVLVDLPPDPGRLAI